MYPKECEHCSEDIYQEADHVECKQCELDFHVWCLEAHITEQRESL